MAAFVMSISFYQNLFFLTNMQTEFFKKINVLINIYKSLSFFKVDSRLNTRVNEICYM